MDQLKLCLCDVINKACTKLIPDNTFYHETLLCITADDTSSFTFHLHGGTQVQVSLTLINKNL